MTGANGAPGGTGQITTRGADDMISGAVATGSDAVGAIAGHTAIIWTTVNPATPTGNTITDSQAIAGTGTATAGGGNANINVSGGSTVSNSIATGGNAGEGVDGGTGGAGGIANITTTAPSNNVADSTATGGDGGTGTGIGFTGGAGESVNLTGPATGQNLEGADGADNP